MKPLKLLLISFLVTPLLLGGEPIHEDSSITGNKTVGGNIGQYPGWDVVPGGGAIIRNEDWITGRQSLALLPGFPPTEAVRELPMGIDPLYLEVWLRPAAGAPSSNTGIDVEGAHVRFIEEGGLGAILAGKEPVRDFRFGLVEGGFADRWIRIAVEIEREAKQWSLAVDGELLIEGVPLDQHSFPGEVVFYGDENTTIYVDALQASAETFPQFGDKRVSGEDNETGNSGTRTAASDPNLAKITGESTIETEGADVLRGALAAGVLDIVYVDNGVGDDAFDGAAAAIESPGRGPVASLGAALARVRDGGTIVVYEGAFVYSDNLGALNGRSINIRTVGNVRVRSEG